MRRHSDIRQSAAVSAVLLVLLFALPLAVVTPFRRSCSPADPHAGRRSGSPFSRGTWTGRWC